MAVEIPQNEEISGGGKNTEGGVGSAIDRKRANRGCTNIKERKRVFSEMLTPT